MIKTRILIFGATGMLGHKIVQLLSRRKYLELYGVNKNLKKRKLLEKNFNIKFIEQKDKISKKNLLIFFNKNSFDYVINCLGIIKQKDKKFSKKEIVLINSKFPKIIDELSSHHKFKFIHFSTDCVFTGKKGNYSEKDFRDAKDLYGISKKNGEDLKKNNTLILRTSFIGHELFDNKSLLSWFLKTKQKNIQGYSKAFFSGLTNLEISRFIYSIIVKKNFYPGIFNLSGSKISKYELLKIINTKYKLNKNINKDEAVKIDRSLLNKKIIKKFKFKNKSWNKLIDQMKNDFDIYKKNLY
jgi:dTDP-4-dehydrorhamnose reductase